MRSHLTFVTNTKEQNISPEFLYHGMPEVTWKQTGHLISACGKKYSKLVIFKRFLQTFPSL